MKSSICCNKFEYHLKSNTSEFVNLGMSISIIKLSLKMRTILGHKYEYKAFIVQKSEDNFEEVLKWAIDYCPFCGSKLSKHYYNDKYINEYNHDY